MRYHALRGADPAALDPLIGALVPRLEGEASSTLISPTTTPGLRDYWALTVLCGASPEGDFRPADAVTLIGLTRSLHFRPGTAYSYSNGNFRMLALAVEQKTGRDFGEMLTERLLVPSGMETARFVAWRPAPSGGAAGYEGTSGSGWRPGINRLHWSGDAGIRASIDDLVARERFIDRTRDDLASPYALLARPVSFRNGAPASYGMGLVHRKRWGRAITGHGGAIRGWRLQRFWVPSERLSVDIAPSITRATVIARGDACASRSAGRATLLTFRPHGSADIRRHLARWQDWTAARRRDQRRRNALSQLRWRKGGPERGSDGVARGLDMTLTSEADGLRDPSPRRRD